MAFFLLLPGAGGAAWYWDGVVARLRAAGHEAVAVDFPGDDDSAGLPEYAAIAVAAARGHASVVLVAQSMGGFSAPRVAEQISVERIVLVNAMIPVPGEAPSEWGEHTGSAGARVARAKARGYSMDFDESYFFHDVPPPLLAQFSKHDRKESARAFAQQAEFTAWPQVPIHVLVGEDDRLFPADFQERVARERLGASAQVERVPGGHLAGLVHPEAIAERLLAFVGDR